MRSQADIEQTITEYGDVVWRTCIVNAQSYADAEDIYQDTFLRYALAESILFNDEDHKKAWLIRVAINRCRDVYRASTRCRTLAEGIEPVGAYPTSPNETPSSFTSDVVSIMRLMSDPPRSALYLSLVLEYPAKDIAALLDVPVNTVYSWIHRGKAKLKEALS